MVKKIIIILTIISLGVGLYFGLKLVRESQDLRRSAANENILVNVFPVDGTVYETTEIGDVFWVTIHGSMVTPQSIGMINVRIRYDSNLLEIVDESSVIKNIHFNSPVGSVTINNIEGYVDVLASVIGSEMTGLLTEMIKVEFKVKGLGNARVYVDREFDQLLIGGVNGKYGFVEDGTSATYRLGPECPVNMEKNAIGNCVCIGTHVDCDDDISNGCELEGLCNKCNQNSDCKTCRNQCASVVPALGSCSSIGVVFTCQCLNNTCEKVTTVPCLANMERNTNGVCVCKEGFFSCNSNPLDGCESNTVCNQCVEAIGTISELVDWYKVYKDGFYDAKVDYDCNDDVDIQDLIVWYRSYKNGAAPTNPPPSP